MEIARALAAAPRYILLDEPFAGVDPISVLDIQRIINDSIEIRDVARRVLGPQYSTTGKGDRAIKK